MEEYNKVRGLSGRGLGRAGGRLFADCNGALQHGGANVTAVIGSTYGFLHLLNTSTHGMAAPNTR